MSNKKQNFARLFKSRLQKLEKDIFLITNLANTSNYEYTENDYKEAVKVLRNGANLVDTIFKNSLRKKRRK